MPTKKLDARVVASAKAPKSGRLELWDTLLPAFGLRITDKNARTYFIVYRAPEDRKQRRLKIGDAKVMTLGEAREAARDALRKVAHGVDPAEDRRPSPVKVSSIGSVRAVASDYSRTLRPEEHAVEHFQRNQADVRSRRAAYLGRAADRQHHPPGRR